MSMIKHTYMHMDQAACTAINLYTYYSMHVSPEYMMHVSIALYVAIGICIYSYV